jgi:glycosyltransferase involved in cell wall biosynthesis
VFVADFLHGGGVGRGLEVKASWFTARGYTVDVVSWHVVRELSGRPNPTLAAFARAGIPVRDWALRGRGTLLRQAARLAMLSLRRGARIVVGHGLRPNTVAGLAKLISGGRLRAIGQIHNESSLLARMKVSPSLVSLARRMHRRLDAVVAVSAAVGDDAAGFLGLERAQVQTIFNPFPLAAIRTAAAGPLPPVAAGLGEYVVACGRLAEMKAFPDLISAFRRVRERHPRLSLLILGEGPDREALVDHAAREGVAAHLHMPGHVDDPYPCFRHARALAFTSHFGEASPRVLVEALACEVPIVASRCRLGAAEIVEEGRCALLYEPGDVDALAAALSNTLERPDEARERVAHGRVRVEEFAAERILPRLEQCYLGR